MPPPEKHRHCITTSLLVVMILPVTFFLSSCRQHSLHNLSGTAIGTCYSITYIGREDRSLPAKVDSVIALIDREFSIFDTASVVSQLNANRTDSLPDDLRFLLALSQNISENTDGAFDVTIGPMVRIMGFGNAEPDTAHRQQRQQQLDSVRQFVGYRKISFSEGRLQKQDKRIQLDFNAIAKGYAVDKIARLLQEEGYRDFLVDVGGELLASGKKEPNRAWRVGVQIPTETKEGMIETDYIFKLPPTNGQNSVATSGNYRNYKEIDGKRYSHIINPQTGNAENNSLLSVSVIAGDCASADAYATAFMVLGIEKSMAVLQKHRELAAHFIYYDHGNYRYRQTDNFPQAIQ